jgi:hypothetical protein
MLLHLKNQFPAIGHWNRKRLMDSRQKNFSATARIIERDINDCSYHLGYSSYIILHKE